MYMKNISMESDKKGIITSVVLFAPGSDFCWVWATNTVGLHDPKDLVKMKIHVIRVRSTWNTIQNLTLDVYNFGCYCFCCFVVIEI